MKTKTTQSAEARKKPATTKASPAVGTRAIEGGDATPVAHEPPAGVGARLRYVRELHGLSQRELARRSDLNHGTIRCIENETISPSVGSLRKILDSLPITLSEFFSLDPETETKVFFQRDELLEVGAGGISLLQVGHNLKGRPLQVLLERYAPGAETAAQPYSHQGDEGGVVIQGQVEVTVGGVTKVLGPGDGFLFSSRLPHRFRNVGDVEAVVVSANTPPL
ncbi:cupin domain-containing protein [Roseateles toxinivorans]|uniref:XRE family transcriptional regulator n=1 Tax=Roseateles toxinivorans TaxID=270368 RepID=A0A4R6QFS9_9BURK|nr:cupin domain-containing protein [Roseateles toxinivorans]TDP61250.1 XRE family transcriptional regulator [Roseateles toxinivorans]